MKKKSLGLIITLLLIIQCFGFSFSFADAKSQPDVCNGPSHEMGLYQQFQNEILSAIGGEALNEKRYTVSLYQDGLFSQGVLDLPVGNTTLNLVASSVHDSLRAAANAGTTTAVLLGLSTASVVQSNMEGFGILFKDRPIVRDYKSLLDIETEITQAAYWKSQEVSLTHKFNGNLKSNLQQIIKKYVDLGLLDPSSEVKSDFSLSNLFFGMTYMNSRMKLFIVYHGDEGNILKNYNGCRGGSADSCNITVKFSEEAIKNLTESYSGIGAFGSCDTSFLYFNNSLKKAIGNNSNLVKRAGQDMKDAFIRLGNALRGTESKNQDADTYCKGMTDYEIARMEAYRGDTRSCDDTSRIATPSLEANKKALGQFRESTTEARNANQTNTKSIIDDIKDSSTTAERHQTRYKYFGTGSYFNSEYDIDLGNQLSDIFIDTMASYKQSQLDSVSSDLSDELIEIMALMEQINTLSNIVGQDSNGTQGTLRNVIKYQCSG